MRNVAAAVIVVFLGLYFSARSLRLESKIEGAQDGTLNDLSSPGTKTRLSASGSTEPPKQLQDFRARCDAPGVLVCQGFDRIEALRPASYSGSGLFPAWDGSFRGTIDTDVKASGVGSLRFEVPTHSAANTSGFWRQSFGRSFGEGTTFYVQFRQRFSAEMLKNNWGGTTWKQVIFHNDAQTCTDLGIVTAQSYHNGFPIMYTECGARGVATNNGRPPYLLQQGDFNCWYRQYNAKDCFLYPAEEWVTFYYQVSVGHWGQPDSNINSWVARDGQRYRQWIKIRSFVLQNAHPGRDYDSLTLLTYMTGKSISVGQPTAFTWFDELIISSQPIGEPTASAASK